MKVKYSVTQCLLMKLMLGRYILKSVTENLQEISPVSHFNIQYVNEDITS